LTPGAGNRGAKDYRAASNETQWRDFRTEGVLCQTKRRIPFTRDPGRWRGAARRRRTSPTSSVRRLRLRHGGNAFLNLTPPPVTSATCCVAPAIDDSRSLI
jgi:hypothetical protein